MSASTISSFSIVFLALFITTALGRASVYNLSLQLPQRSWLTMVLCCVTVGCVTTREPTLRALPDLAALAAAIVCAWTDIELGLVFDHITIPAVAFVIVLRAPFGEALAALAGATVGAACLLSLHAITRGRGMGIGDVKLAAVLGAALGPLAAVEALGVAFVCGAITGVCTYVWGSRQSREIRFAPHLALGTCAIYLLRTFA